MVKGFDVWDVALARFAEAGGRAVTSLADCAAGVDALVLMVVNAEQADSVLFAEDGALVREASS